MRTIYYLSAQFAPMDTVVSANCPGLAQSYFVALPIVGCMRMCVAKAGVVSGWTHTNLSLPPLGSFLKGQPRWFPLSVPNTTTLNSSSIVEYARYAPVGPSNWSDDCHVKPDSKSMRVWPNPTQPTNTLILEAVTPPMRVNLPGSAWHASRADGV